MSVSKKVLDVPFAEAVKKFSDFQGGELMVSFDYDYEDYNGIETETVYPIKATTLYRWATNCPRRPMSYNPKLPSNETKIYNLKIELPTDIILEIIEEIEFQELIDRIGGLNFNKIIRVYGHATATIVWDLEVFDDDNLDDKQIYKMAKEEFFKSGGIDVNNKSVMIEDDIDFDSHEML